MDYERPISISVSDLQSVIAKSLEGTLNQSSDPAQRIALKFDPGIIGFILRDPLPDVSIEGITKVADRVSSNVEGPTEAAVLIRDGVITIGFIAQTKQIDFLG